MHNLNFNEQLGRHAFASVREVPWHKLGIVVPEPMTAQQAITFGGLDYFVEKKTIWTFPDGDYAGKKIPEQFATVRMDNKTPLGVVGKHYSVLQNRDAFKFFDAMAGEGFAMFETVGALGRGERIFATAKLPESIQVGPDLVGLYLFLTNDHTGNRGVRMAFTPVRIVCNNTLNMALADNKNMISVRHMGDMIEAMKKGAKMMQQITGLATTWSERANRMAEFKITDEKLLELIAKAMLPQREVASEELSQRSKQLVFDVYDYSVTHHTQQPVAGTLWGFVNGITGYHQNVLEKDSAGVQMNYILEGLGARRNAAAWNLAMDAMGLGLSDINVNN